MKVVSKQDIEKMDDDLKIEKKKHEKDLNKVVNPPKMKPISKMRSEGASSRINLNQFKSLAAIPTNQPPRYNEYKQSLRQVAAETVSKLAPDEADTVKDKLMASRDIANICADKLFDLDLIENEWLVLGLTIAGKILEAKTGV
jgi:hypothetical protein